MRVICWFPALTDHQSHTIEELKKKFNGNLDIHVFNLLHKGRLNQGWSSNHADNLEKKNISYFLDFKTILKSFNHDKNIIHIFGSPFENLSIVLTLILAILFKQKIYLISEPYSIVDFGYLHDRYSLLNKLKRKLRPYIYRIYALFIRKQIQGVFAISQNAISQYIKLGIPHEKIFPFAYFVPDTPGDLTNRHVCKRSIDSRLKIVFVGNLIFTKGLDLLLSAIDRINLNELKLVLTVYGNGDVSKFNFDGVSKIYRGVIPFGNAQSVIHKYDFLVLPSRYDGWGVVVNESIMANVPVIVSNMVGASSMIKKWNCGLIFDSNKAGDLDKKLKCLMNPDLSNQLKNNTKKLKKFLSPEYAANYIYQILLSRSASNIREPKFHCYNFYYE
jgi:glycosyltransferase involved in cell wall biosynthesis